MKTDSDSSRKCLGICAYVEGKDGEMCYRHVSEKEGCHTGWVCTCIPGHTGPHVACCGHDSHELGHWPNSKAEGFDEDVFI